MEGRENMRAKKEEEETKTTMSTLKPKLESSMNRSENTVYNMNQITQYESQYESENTT